MRIGVEFYSESGIKIPVKYNYYFQSFIYNLSPNSNIHNQGFGERKYKLFTFSRPIGKHKYSKEDKSLIFKDSVKWIISAVDNNFLEEIATNLIKAHPITVGNQKLIVHSIEVMKPPPQEAFKKPLFIKMLSPITIYSTLYDSTGSRKTYFYSPFEYDFSEKLNENLKRKFKAFYNKTPPDYSFEIQAINPKKEWEKITTYKQTIIKGWMGIYRVQGPPELLKLAYDGGLGSRNSQGFGCFEIIPERG